MIRSTAEIRKEFLDFFRSKNHKVITSSSLVPNKDPTLLFTNAGMNQFKDVFRGLDKRDYSCATTSQRCVRAGGKYNDLKNVGYTARHHTFFEMLGNFSFGNYFKYDAIKYAWELLTSKNWFNLSKERLWITTYEKDEESYDIWKKEIGIPHERIIRIGNKKDKLYASDNFWKMGDVGPCGPCTEIFYDYGDHILGGPPGSKEENGERYVEIWNIVFMQFNSKFDGTMEPLPKLSVDTGMGLERIAAVLQHVNSNYEIDLFRNLIESVMIVTGINDVSNKSLRVIADHIRSCAYLVADGIIPSHGKRGYVLRRIIRRAIYHGNMLGVKNTFFYKLVTPLIEVMGEVGKILKKQQSHIEQVLKKEEEQFLYKLKYGPDMLYKVLSKVKNNTLDGETVFLLHDTYGFPVDLTVDLCRAHNIKVDEEGFNAAMEEQRSRARKFSCFHIDYTSAIYVDKESEFQGYEYLELDSKVFALFVNNKPVNKIVIGQEAIVFLEKTPFYAESGGQVGDKGALKNNNICFTVNSTQRYGKAIGHLGKMIEGSLKVQDNVLASVDKIHRTRIQLNHSATHILHASLHRVVGTHILQRGSLINDQMLRFDFSHFRSITSKEIQEIEDLVNAQIRCNLPIETIIMNLDEAKEKDVIALFNEKYDEFVRVLKIGNFSSELCAGTHASRTGDIGMFHIISEFGIAAGVRRIEALTGDNAIANIRKQSDQLCDIAQLLQCDRYKLSDKVRSVLTRMYQLEKELQKFKEKIISQEKEKLFKKVIIVKGIKLLVNQLVDVDPKMLHTIVNNIKNQLGSTVIVLATVDKNKVFFIVRVSKDIINLIKAEEIIYPIAKQIKGKGGGCSDIAQASGTDVAILPSLLFQTEKWIKEKL